MSDWQLLMHVACSESIMQAEDSCMLPCAYESTIKSASIAQSRSHKVC